jgi:hypothetical protein
LRGSSTGHSSRTDCSVWSSTHPEYRRLLEATDGEVRIWQELPSEDPWRFYLSRLEIDRSGNVLTHEKTFVHRTSGQIDSGRREHLYLYTAEGVQELLSSVGFRDIRLYGSWTEEPYSGGELMIVTALK